MIEFFNLYYLIFLGSGIVIFFALYFLLRNKSEKTKYDVLLLWLFINFALHFLKQLAPEYDFPTDIHKSTLENICATSTVLFPFIFLLKDDSPIHDFMFFIGVMGGLAAFIYPTEALNKPVLRFETFRFYFCHFTLFAVPLLSAMLNIHRPKLKRFWIIPLLFLVYEFIILVNEVFLISTGLTEATVEQFFSRDYRNNAFIFGPTSDLGVVSEIISWLCPSFMKKDVLNVIGGGELYWPIVWLIIPSYVLFTPLYALISLPFTKFPKPDIDSVKIKNHS